LLASLTAHAGLSRTATSYRSAGTAAAGLPMLQKLVNDGQGSWPAGAKRWAGGTGLAIAVGVAYFLTAELGLALLTSTEHVAVFWPAAGISVGILIALGPWARAPVAVAVIGASAAAALLTDRNVWSALSFGLCNAGEALLARWLIERWFGPVFNLDNLRRVVGFFAAAAITTATSALGAAGAMKLFGPSTADFLDIWQVWFASDALGVVTVAPLLIGTAAAVRNPPPWRELLEGTLVVVAVAIANIIALALLTGSWSLITPLIFLFPLLLWLSARCRPVFSAAAAFTVAAAIVWTTIYEFGRYGDPSQAIADRALAAKLAMLGTALAALALAALFAERRRHVVALGESATRLRSILDAANVIAWDVDLTTYTVHSTGPITRLLHRPDGSVPGNFTAMVETIHPEDRDSVMAQFWTAVSAAATYRLEFRLNSDVLRWVTAEGSIERDAKGRPVRALGITHDITERKKAELALAERDAQLGLAGKAARVGSFAINIGTGMVQNSPGYASLHGLAEGTKEFPREEWRTRVHPDDLGQLDALRSQAFAERRGEHTTEYRIVGSDGKTRWIESRSLLSYDSNGRPTRIVGVNIDITERKRAVAALEESEARYRALYDDNPSMYFTVDASGTVLSVNEFGARQLGYTPAELVGQSVLEVVHEEDREAALRHLASCADGTGSVVAAELRKLHRDGSIVWVREVARAVRETAGQRTVLLLVCEEVTERKRAEEHQRLLVAELDHRVKNVLATVQAVAAHSMETSSSIEHFVAAFDGRIRSMGSTHELLSHRRWLGIPLAELVEQQLAPYTTVSNTNIDGPDVLLSAEAGQTMAMTLHELATNAAKYGALSTPRGRVSVRWKLRSNGHGPATLELEWHEQGGPVVTFPAQAGFGTSVVRDLIPYELGGTVELKFAPDGVHCVIVIPGEQAHYRDDVANASTEFASIRY
jgi:PAS domain S-box-containing protein